VSDRARCGRSRLQGSEVGGALFLGEVVDHHVLRSGQRPGAPKQLGNSQPSGVSVARRQGFGRTHLARQAAWLGNWYARWVPPGRARFLTALADAHVEYVLVAGTGRRRLRLALPVPPANLNALGGVLGRFGATMRPVAAGGGVEGVWSPSSWVAAWGSVLVTWQATA